MIALCSVLRGTGAFYSPHHRNYGAHAIEAYTEAIATAEAAAIPLHLAHTHLGFPNNKGRAPELLAIIDAARGRGVDITFDTYPYLAGNTYRPFGLARLGLCRWCRCRRSLDCVTPACASELRVELEETGTDGFHGVPIDWSWIVVGGVGDTAQSWAVGHSIAELATQRGERPVDLFCSLAADDRLMATALHEIGNEENVRTIMQHPAHTAGSDGILVGGRPHPAWLGNVPSLPRSLRARARHPHARGGGPPHDERSGCPSRPGRPRPRASGHGRRPRRVRPRAHQRHGHVREPAPDTRRYSPRLARRRTDGLRRQANRALPWSRTALTVRLLSVLPLSLRDAGLLGWGGHDNRADVVSSPTSPVLN